MSRRVAVFPTRMALTTWKGKKKGAERGYELLKKKRDALKKRFHDLCNEIADVRPARAPRPGRAPAPRALDRTPRGKKRPQGSRAVHERSGSARWAAWAPSTPALARATGARGPRPRRAAAATSAPLPTATPSAGEGPHHPRHGRGLPLP